MNWMTSGRHRALRTKRGEKRSEMHFPAHVQRELTRVRRHPLAQTSDATARNGGEGTAWYIRSVMDSNQSHDFQMLELSREAAAAPHPSSADEAKRASDSTLRDSTPPPVSTPSEAAPNERAKPTAVERRCVFTPVKAANRQRPRPTEQSNSRTVKRIASPPPPPQDLLLFNEGEELSKPASSLQETSHKPPHEDRTTRVKPATTRFAGARERFSDASGADQRRISDAASFPFYAASSSTEDETTEYTKSSYAPHQTITVDSSFLDGQASTNRVRHSQKPTFSGLNLFQSIERELQFKRESAIQMDTTLNSSLGFAREDPVALAVEFATPEHFQSRSSTKSDVIVERSQQAKRRRLSQMTQELQHNEQPQLLVIASPDQPGDDDDGRESTSSQGSFVLPPPVDWHKRLASCPRPEEPVDMDTSSPSEPASWKSEQDRHLQPEDLSVRYNQQRSSHGSSTWTMSARTSGILNKILEDANSPIQKTADAKNELHALRQRLRKKQDVAIYLFTLVQCHRIDDLYHKCAIKHNEIEEIQRGDDRGATVLPPDDVETPSSL